MYIYNTIRLNRCSYDCKIYDGEIYSFWLVQKRCQREKKKNKPAKPDEDTEKDLDNQPEIYLFKVNNETREQ